MKETTDINFDLQKDFVRLPWWSKPIYWGAFLLTFLWLFIVVDYFFYSGWWSNRFYLSPAEFVGVISSQLLPFALIWFVVIIVEQKGRLHQETELLRHYMAQLMYPTEEGAIYTQTLTTALREQTHNFKTVFADVSKQTNIVRDDLKQWVEDIAIVVDRTDNLLQSLTKEVVKKINLFASSAEKVNDVTRQTTSSLQERAYALQSTGEKIAQVIGGISGVLGENMNQADSVAEKLSSSADKTNNIVQQAREVSESLAVHSGRLDEIFKHYDAQTQLYNKQLFDNAEKILAVLKTQGAFLDEEVEKSVHKMSVAQEKAAEQSQALFQMSDQAIHHLNDVGGQFVLQTEVMNQALKETQTKVKQLVESGIHEEAQKLIETSQKVSQYFHQIRAGLKDTQTEQFMKDARLILEHLSTFSMDIVHVFTPKAEEDLWKKYYAGDNASFMRHLIVALPEKNVDKVKELFQKNPACRVAMVRYMAEFDALVDLAKSSEKRNVLLPVFVGSDAGRLYMILKHIVGSKKKETGK